MLFCKPGKSFLLKFLRHPMSLIRQQIHKKFLTDFLRKKYELIEETQSGRRQRKIAWGELNKETWNSVQRKDFIQQTSEWIDKEVLNFLPFFSRLSHHNQGTESNEIFGKITHLLPLFFHWSAVCFTRCALAMVDESSMKLCRCSLHSFSDCIREFSENPRHSSLSWHKKVGSMWKEETTAAQQRGIRKR